MIKKIEKFYLAIGIAIAMILLVAVQDYKMYPASFWGYANILGFAAAAMFYVFRRDLSEALAVFLTYLIMLHTGLEDMFYFIIGEGFPKAMDTLYNHYFIGTVAKVLGADTVTPFTLCASVALGAYISYKVIIWLKKQPW